MDLRKNVAVLVGLDGFGKEVQTQVLELDDYQHCDLLNPNSDEFRRAQSIRTVNGQLFDENGAATQTFCVSFDEDGVFLSSEVKNMDD